MTRGVWAGFVVCAFGGCAGLQYYNPPPDQPPPPTQVGSTVVQIVDERPEWERKPFTGDECLYHLGKCKPDAWAQLSEEVQAAVAAMPQKPERVEVVVTSFRLVNRPDKRKPYRDLSAGPNPNPQLANSPVGRRLAALDAERAVPRDTRLPPESRTRLDLTFASDDDPRRKIQEHPLGSSCAIQATVRVVYPGGQEQSVDVKTIARGQEVPGELYTGGKLEFATKAAVADLSRQFGSGVGVSPDS